MQSLAEGAIIHPTQPRKFLVILCGLPSSGKTTLATRLALLMESHGIPTAVIGSDNFRRMMPIYQERFPPDREPLIRRGTLHTTAFFLGRGVSVVSDDTNYYSSMRHELVELAKRAGAIYAIVSIETPLEIALKWNEERGLSIPQSVIASINEKFEKPGSKYKWDRSLASFDLSRTPADKAAEEVLKLLFSLKHEEKKAVPSSSMGDEIDRATRKIVSEAVRRVPSAARALSEARKSFVREALKAGLTTVDAERAFRKRVEEILNELDAKGR